MALSRLTGDRILVQSLLYTTVLLVILVILGVYITFEMTRAAVYDDQIEQTRTDAALAGQAITEAVWDMSPERAMGILEALGQKRGFVGAEIYDDTDTLFESHLAVSEVPNDDHLIIEEAEIIKDDMNIGHFKLMISTEHLEEKIMDTAETLALGGFIALVVLIVVQFFTLRSIVGPIVTMTGTMTALSNGDLDEPVPALNRHDEIGKMARAVEVFKQNAIQKVELEREQEETKRQAEENRRKDMLSIADQLEADISAVVKSVNDSAGNLNQTATELAGAARNASDSAMTVTSASEEATANVETVAAAAEQLNASIREINQQIRRSADIAKAGVGEAEKANTQVDQLTEAAQRIGKVVDLITEIASQTNLLALNATIEAARAGEAGKGFAVVAQEVKNLATQTANATKDISSQVSNVQAVSGETASSISQISGILVEINGVIGAISTAVEEQGASTQEIARSVQEASQGTRSVSNSIVVVSDAAKNSGDLAARVMDMSSNIAQQAETQTYTVENFLKRIRSL